MRDVTTSSVMTGRVKFCPYLPQLQETLCPVWDIKLQKMINWRRGIVEAEKVFLSSTETNSSNRTCFKNGHKKWVSNKRRNQLCLQQTTMERSKLPRTCQKSSIKIYAYHRYLEWRQKNLRYLSHWLLKFPHLCFYQSTQSRSHDYPLLNLLTYHGFHCSPSSLGEICRKQSNYNNYLKTFCVSVWCTINTYRLAVTTSCLYLIWRQLLLER